MEKSSLTALTHQQLTLARTASSGHSSHTVYGGHEQLPRHTRPSDRRPDRPSGENAPEVDPAINGRNVEVPEHYRVHVAQKMAHVHRYNDKIINYVVELFHEHNRHVLTVVSAAGSAEPPKSE